MTSDAGRAEGAIPAPRQWSLIQPDAHHADMVASWVRSAEEGGFWCSRAEHPFPASAIIDWWQDSDTQPWVLLGPDALAVAYGEIWVDDEEDEVELARLIVDPARRRTGVGRRLVNELVTLAKGSGRAACFIRVAPGNDGALALYRAAGFEDVDEATAAQWNQGQPAAYHWLEHRAIAIEAASDVQSSPH